ncbi:hypothetical protein M2352_001675 [Azospirillum fermentarium]|uniref:DUF29 domain-containing protein n=1 Tax=Azospirillum fermentarium TaxID=1233114 RepID=UPI0022264E1F|nr:DUF29 domain-containing protein [Azospirillum fermentarium]MCW2246084.1 hypothetical protein [Azospirillum fermentarium]
MPDGVLYDTDFLAWTEQQAAALRRMAAARANTELDLHHLAELLDDMGASERRALESDLACIIEHLLKLEHSPAEAPRRKWRASVAEHRGRVAAALEDSPSLRRRVSELLPRAWDRGRFQAAGSLQDYDSVDPDTLPEHCPYTLDDLLDRTMLPPNRHGLA